MDDSRAHSLDRATSLGLIIIAVIQGYALYALHLAIEHDHWLATDARWLKALYTLSVALPAFYLISTERLRDRINLLPLLLIPLLFWLGWHLGWVEQTPEPQRWNRHDFTPAFCVAVGIALFILTLFFRSRAASGGWPRAYQPLLGYSWEHALTLAQLGLFVGLFWGLLTLWAALFSAIGLGFFKSLFQEPAFIYPVTWLVIGLGLVMIRNRFRFIANVRLMTEALIKALLPLVALIILLFFAVLPWTGLQPVWDTGRAAQMLMVLMLTLLFFFNAVFHHPDEAPYPGWLRSLIMLAVVLLPLGSLLAAWALWLRIDQYGLSLDRLWAVLLQVLTATFTLTYSVLLLRRRLAALPSLQRANLWLGLLVAVVLLLINTPLVDMRHWAAQNQVQRLLDGRTQLDAFDYSYLRFQLGQPGVLALQSLAASEHAQTHPELARRIDRVLTQKQRWSRDPLMDTNNLKDVALQFTTNPSGTIMPDALLSLLVQQDSSCLIRVEPCRAVNIADQPRFQWLIHTHNDFQVLAYAEIDGQWQPVGTLDLLGAAQQQHTDACRRASPTPELEAIPGPLAVFRSGLCLYSLKPGLDAARQQLLNPPDEQN